MESKLWHDIFVSLIVGVLFASGPVVTGWVLALLTNNPSLLENLYERASVFLWSVPVAIVFYLILLFFRWKRLENSPAQQQLLFLITLMLGCSIVGLLLQPQKKNPDLMLIGSGSVHGYLKEVFPSLLKENATPKVLVLEGSSDAGQRLLTDAYQDKDNDRLPEVPFLAMASKQLKIEEFQVQRPLKDRFFEIQIGIDPYKGNTRRGE